MVSLIVPAHNEAALLGETLAALRASAEQCGERFEIIVVDDASTDGTAAIASELGARVESVELRKISAVRNAGARVAAGDILVFVDADTWAKPETLRNAIAAVRAGAVGGGATFRLDRSPLWGRVLMGITCWMFFLARQAAGCFVFARREDFDAIGGFDERYFAAEELVLTRALKRRGRFVVVRPAVVTSGRKFEIYSFWHGMRTMLRILVGGLPGVRRERPSFWYRAMR